MNAKTKCQNIIKAAISKGYIQQISVKELQKIIAQTIGVIDDRSVLKWQKALETFDYVTVSFPVYKWNMANLAEIPAIQQLTIEQAERETQA